MIEHLHSHRVVIGNEVKPARIAFEGGRISSIEPYLVRAAQNAPCVLPGIVDTHVHVNDPGRAHWEGFETATRAAAAGGCTCIVDMPLNSIPATTTVEALERKRAAAERECFVDYAFWGGVVPGNIDEIKPLAESGVRGFKCFLSDSGVPEFLRVTEADLHLAMPIISETGLPLLVHAECPGTLNAARSGLEEADWSSYATYVASRPVQAEMDAIELMIRLCRKYKCRIHIVHVSAAEALPLIKHAKLDGLPITAETCPHYLYFAAEDIQAGATQFKCAPPIRNKSNREQLWQGLADGTLDLIATDHSPCPPQLKSGDFETAWGGISSLSLALPVIYTAARQRGFDLADVCRWMASGPAKLAGFKLRKGTIAADFDADFVVFDPDAHFEVTPNRLHFRHPCCPYIGETLTGEVKQVFVRGDCVFKNGEFPASKTGREVSLRLASR